MLSVMTLLAVACTDELVPEENLTPEAEKPTGEQVFFTSGTTENDASTRANTYYMESESRFVCQMYFKTDASGDQYDLSRTQTAWMKVEDWHNVPESSPGNSLYWNKEYSPDVTKFDDYRNDDNASIFYWQNRKAHAFLAWTDLNNITAMSGADRTGSLNFSYATDDSYSYKTGQKVSEWVENGYFVWGRSTQYDSFSSVYNGLVKPDYFGDKTLFSAENQSVQLAKKDELASRLPSQGHYHYYDEEGLGYYAKEYACTVPDAQNQDLQTKWHVICFFGEENRKVYQMPTDPDDASVSERDGFVYDSNNVKVAKVVGEGETKVYYECDAHGRIRYNEENPLGWVCIYCPETKEIVDEVVTIDAKKIDLRGTSYTSMAAQPDILVAYEPEKVPTSAVMELNRVHLYFKHQFSQVQINLKNAEDNSVQITAGQIKKVELLGVTEYGYVFPYIYYEENSDVAKVRPTTFKEVVATDYSDQQLNQNPYGTSFELYPRTLSPDETTVYNYLKSYEGITFGRLQAIRITWQETETEGGVTHVSTYRVPETNEIGQNLRLLESGVKYIWNIELRRGTLAVIHTEIIPWVVNQESYVVDGSIVTSQPTQ